MFYIPTPFTFFKRKYYFSRFSFVFQNFLFTFGPCESSRNSHPETKTALQEWAAVVKKSQWTCFADMKGSFADVSCMGDQQYAFGILGNRHQLVVVVNFTIQLINIRSLAATPA